MPPELKIDSLGAVRGLYARKGFFQVQLPDFPAMLRTHETLSRMPAMRLHERLYSPEMPTMPPEISARIIRGGSGCHEAQAPAKILSLKVGLRLTMLVKYHVTWLVHEHASSTNNPVKHVQVASAGHWRTGVQGIIKAAELAKNITPEGHVASRSEDPRAAGIKRILRE
jgi:hypothetical protein